MLAPGRRAIRPGADGLCTSALTQLEARLIQLSLWDTLGSSPWGGLEVALWTGPGGGWGWRSRKAPRPGANKRPFLWPDLSWRAARGAHGPGWGGVAKVTLRWAGDGQRRRYHERPEAQLHLRCLWRVGAPPCARACAQPGSCLGAVASAVGKGAEAARQAYIQVVRGTRELPCALLGVHVHHMWG